MSVAAEAVAFLGAEGVITTAAIAVIGYRLLARASVTTARAAGRTRTATAPVAVTETVRPLPGETKTDEAAA